MEYRALGGTGIRVSALGFGCGNIGGIMVRGEASEQLLACAKAIEMGINYFDTAPAYGNGQSEENLGRVLQELKAEVFVGTKFRIPPQEVNNATALIRGSLEASLRRLRRDYVDLLQLHNRVVLGRGTGSDALGVSDVLGPVVEGLHSLQQGGLVRFIGFTGMGDTEAVHQVIDSGAFDTVQSYFNILNPSAGQEVGPDFPAQDFRRLIDRATEANIGVIVVRALGAGALSARTERHPVAGNPGGAAMAGSEYEADLRMAQLLEPLARELGLENTVELALRYAMGKVGVSTMLVGFSDLEQLEAAFRWVERGPLKEDPWLWVSQKLKAGV